MRPNELFISFCMMLAGVFLGVWASEYFSTLGMNNLFYSGSTYLFISLVMLFCAAILSLSRVEKEGNKIGELLRIQSSELEGIELHQVAISEKVDLIVYESAGFKVIDNKDLVELALSKMKESGSMRIMGNPKKDSVKTDKDNTRQRYFSETENYLKENPQFAYRRIYTGVPDEDFKIHLDNIKKLDKNGMFRVLNMVGHEGLINYQIFDETYMLLGIRTEIIPGVDDLNLVFSNINEEVVGYFINHFDRAWGVVDENN